MLCRSVNCMFLSQLVRDIKKKKKVWGPLVLRTQTEDASPYLKYFQTVRHSTCGEKVNQSKQEEKQTKELPHSSCLFEIIWWSWTSSRPLVFILLYILHCVFFFHEAAFLIACCMQSAILCVLLFSHFQVFTIWSKEVVLSIIRPGRCIFHRQTIVCKHSLKVILSHPRIIMFQFRQKSRGKAITIPKNVTYLSRTVCLCIFRQQENMSYQEYWCIAEYSIMFIKWGGSLYKIRL